MLTEVQQDNAREAIAEFVSALTSDPVRVFTKDLHQLQTILASYGLTIEALKKEGPIPMPARAMEALAQQGIIPGPSATQRAAPVVQSVQAPTKPVASKLTPVERGIINTAEKAAKDMLGMPGYCFKATYVLDIVKIAKRVAGEL
jgi:hypothetical protein